MEIILGISLLISFLVTLLVLPLWIKKAKIMGLMGKDINKPHKSEVAEAGGIIVLTGFIMGVLIYVAIGTFVLKQTDRINLEIFVLMSSILIVAFIGIVDSLLAASSNSAESHHSKGWRKGIKNKYRVLLCVFAAIPLMVINSGTSEISLPFLGLVNLSILYPLVLIPLGIVGATTTYNFLAGFNGLETGQGIIILGFLSFISYTTGTTWLALVGLIMVASLVAFYIYNKFPAKIFPSDVLTYPIGALIAIMAILGNFEKIAVFVFVPYILETILKLRGKLKKQSFAIPNKDGSLEMPYDKIYGLTHLSLYVLKKFKKKVYENDVVHFIFIMQILICLASLIIFKGALFGW